MRQFDKNDEHDVKALAKLNAEPWQVELLKSNPGYVFWGPHEDYMSRDSGGWDSRQFFDSWEKFKGWKLDDLNECVNFYFELDRPNVPCTTCGGEGYHPEALPIANSFYAHQAGSEEIAWYDKITQDEADALIAAKRVPEGTTAAEINVGQHRRGVGFGLMHDAINRWILIEARLKRLGLPKDCPTCGGSCIEYTAPKATVALVLWMLHPRKGCSRGIEVKNIEQRDLPEVREWLETAARRNAERFEGIKDIAA